MKQRHFSAMHPIMNKGGVHEKTEKSKRKKQKQDFKRNFEKGDFDKVFRLSFLSRLSVNKEVVQIKGEVDVIYKQKKIPCKTICTAGQSYKTGSAAKSIN